MRIDLPVSPQASVDAWPSTSAQAMAGRLAEIPAIREIARRIGAESGYEGYSAGDCPEALHYASVYTRKGREALEEVLSVTERVHADDEYAFLAAARLREEMAPIVGAVTESTEHIDYDDLLDAIEETLRDVVISAMVEADKSEPIDVIGPKVLVELAFVQGYGRDGMAIDDLFTLYEGHGSSVTSIVPDENFLEFLKLVNVSPTEFAAAVRRVQEIDLTDGTAPEGMSDYARERLERHALEWRAVLEADGGEVGHIARLPLRSKAEIGEWNRRVDLIARVRDLDRPRALSDDDLVNVVDNASYGGVATFVARLPLRRLVKGEYDHPFLATGGFVGLHDFLNGSGYIEKPRAPILIDPAAGSFFVASSRKASIDDVYGIVARYYEAMTESFAIPSWQHVRESMWRRDTDEGHVLVTAATNDDGSMTEYWVQSFDAEGLESEPRATPEVYSDLGSACEEGDRILDRSPIASAMQR